MKRNIKNYTEFLFENANLSQEEFFGVTQEEFDKLLNFEEAATKLSEDIRKEYEGIENLKIELEGSISQNDPKGLFWKDRIVDEIISSRKKIGLQMENMKKSFGNIEPTTEQGKSLVLKASSFFNKIQILLNDDSHQRELHFLSYGSDYGTYEKFNDDIRYQIPEIEKALEDYEIALGSYPKV